MSKPFEFGQTVMIFLTVLGVAWWAGTIWQAKGEDRLVQACAPIEFGTDGMHQLTTALIGYAPRWTLQLQSYLMGGCYYFFTIILPDGRSNMRGYEGGIRVD